MYTIAWWLDFNRTERLTFLATQSDPSILLNEISLLSGCYGPWAWSGNPAPGVVPTERYVNYRDLDTVLLMMFADASNHWEHYAIPAPDVSIATVDTYSANTIALASFITAVINEGMNRTQRHLISASLGGTIVKKWRGNLAGLPSTGALPLYFQSTLWTDGKGQTLWTHYPQINAGTGIVATIPAVSSAGYLFSFGGQFLQVNIRQPAVTAYSTNRDEARLRFSDASGNVASIIIPAPIPSIFLPDQYHIDPAQIINLQNQAFINLQTRQGTNVTKYLSGTRTRRRRWSA